MARLLTPPGALSVTIDPVGKYAYSANGSSNTVSAFKIDPVSGALTPVGVATMPGSADAVRVDVSGTQLYVVGSHSNELSTFSIDASGTLAFLRSTRTRSGPSDFAMATGRPLQYIPKFALVSFSNANKVASFGVDPNTGALSPPIASPSQGAAVTDYSGAVSVAADPSGSFAYVANQAEKEVFGYSINPSSGVFTAVNHSPIPGGPLMEQLAVEPSGRFIYAVDCADNNVWSYALQGLGLSSISGGPFNAGSCPFAVATDPTGRFVYVGNLAGSTISAFAIDPVTGVLTPIGTPVLSSQPTAIAVHPDGKFAYVTNRRTCASCADTIQIFDVNPMTGALTGGGATFPVGLSPAAVTLDPDGKFLYVVDFGTNDGKNPALITPGDITAFTVNEITGGLTPITPVTVVLYSFPYSGDDVSIDPSGKFLYLTIRGDFRDNYPDSISVFSIAPKTGQLSPVQTMTFTPTEQGPSSIVVTGAIAVP